MTVADDDLVGISEIADLAGVTKQAVANWRVRCSDFPKPLKELRAGPVFRLGPIMAWLGTRPAKATLARRIRPKA